MRIHEYQAKQILSDFGVPVPPGKVAGDPAEAAEIFEGLPGRLAVVKAQTHGLGADQARAVGLARSADEAAALARKMIGARIGPDRLRARPINKVLVEQYIEADHFLYLAIFIDPTLAKPVMLAAGQVPRHAPGTVPAHGVSREVIDPRFGTLSFQWRKVTAALGLAKPLLPQVTAVASGLYRAFIECECVEAEIGKLGFTRSGDLMALDARMRFDTNALFRHDEIASLYDTAEYTDTENTLRSSWIRYVALGGRIGCVFCDTGAALVLLDQLADARARPGGIVYLTGDESPEKIAYAVTCLLREETFRAVLVQVPRDAELGGRVVSGVRLAIQDRTTSKPVIVVVPSEDTQRQVRAQLGAGPAVQVVASPSEAAAVVGED